MAGFDARSKVVEVHCKGKDKPFYVHEDLLRQQFGKYGQTIDQASRTSGKVSIKLDLSNGALKYWVDWIYGKPMRDNDEFDDVELLLELHEYCYSQFHHPHVDHKCANACLDGIRTMLDFGINHCGLNDFFGIDGLLSLAEVVTRLEKPGGKGVQMLVDMLVYGDTWKSDHPAIADLIENTESATALAPVFQKLSFALAIKTHNLMHEGDADNVVSTPDPMSPHAYHSYAASDTACCGRRASVEE